MASREQIERASPIPLYECDLKVGDLVRTIATDAGYDPADKLYVVGVEWRHQRGRTDFGWNITIASAANIEKGYGACDGWRPDDLRRDYSVTVDSAITQNEDVAGMVEQLRHAAFTEPEPNRSALHSKASDKLESQAAQIASLSAKVAEVERERDENCAALEEKIRSLSTHETCGCSWDKPEDLCLHHSPRLSAAKARAERLEKAIDDALGRHQVTHIHAGLRAALQQEGESDV